MAILRTVTVFFIAIVSAIATHAQHSEAERAAEAAKTEVWEPQPRIITPGATPADAPSDAIVLLSEKNGLQAWAMEDGKPATWPVEKGIATIKGGSGNIYTKEKFGSVQLHLEFATPTPPKGEGQQRGNSGIFFMDRYEIQVLDSYGSKTYANGQAGSLYKQYPPLANASRPAGAWQSYDIVFEEPTFNKDSSLAKPGYVTVLHNGVLVQNHAEIKGGTVWIGKPAYKAHSPAPIRLQDHGDPVRYRNIWLRKL